MMKASLFEKDLATSSQAEAFSVTVVEPMRGRFDAFRGDGFEPHVRRKESKDDAIRVLVGNEFRTTSRHDATVRRAQTIR